MVIDVIKGYGSFYIYGAQVVAYGAYKAIRHLCGRTPVCFLVGDLDGNPSQIDGVAVRMPDRVPKDALLLICVTELLQGEIVASLKERGVENLFLLSQHEEHLLMSAYFADIGKFPVAEARKGEPADFSMYEVCNHRDKPLAGHPNLRPFERSIQAGADLTEKRIASLLDNTGTNLSLRNRQYCEMTATYWVWKNTRHDWVGIEHYRRHLLVTPEMLAEDVDAVLPLPYVCYPDTVAQFRRFVSQDVLHALLKALKELHPKEYDGYLAILHGQYQYTYNLVCARRQVFDDYCAWFFRITEYMEGMADEVPEIGNTRALSYVAEVLTNLYFMSHQDVWRIRHAEKAIYV